VPETTNYQKAKTNMKTPKEELKMSILKHLHNEPGLTLDVLKQKVAPERSSIYYYVQDLRREEMLTYEEHERPIRLFLTEGGKRAISLRIPSATPLTVRASEGASASERENLSFLSKLVAQKHLELALLYERLSKFAGDGDDCTGKLAA